MRITISCLTLLGMLMFSPVMAAGLPAGLGNILGLSTNFLVEAKPPGNGTGNVNIEKCTKDPLTGKVTCCLEPNVAGKGSDGKRTCWEMSDGPNKVADCKSTNNKPISSYQCCWKACIDNSGLDSCQYFDGDGKRKTVQCKDARAAMAPSGRAIPPDDM